jgi:hypothetical protein
LHHCFLIERQCNQFNFAYFQGFCYKSFSVFHFTVFSHACTQSENFCVTAFSFAQRKLLMCEKFLNIWCRQSFTYSVVAFWLRNNWNRVSLTLFCLLFTSDYSYLFAINVHKWTLLSISVLQKHKKCQKRKTIFREEGNFFPIQLCYCCTDAVLLLFKE